MKTILQLLPFAFLSLVLAGSSALAQTDGNAKLEVTLLDYVGTSGDDHYTVVWVTTGAGQFIKSLRKQGPTTWTSSEWESHCRTWNTARNGSTVLDGYTSATARDYAGTNSPVILTWNCRDASNTLMPDGDYKFWVQYAENSGQGPYTTSGLLWTKGPAGATNTYPNQGANFANMKVTWIATGIPAVAPTITSATPPATGTVGTPYNHTVTATGTAPITFSASGLPTSLSIDPTSGVISGTPTADGTFTGTITAANGTLPNATQAFSIVISAAPVAPTITSVQLAGNNLIASGTGPANGTYHVLVSADPGLPIGQWTSVATNSIDNTGAFTVSTMVETSVTSRFWIIRMAQ